MGKVDVKMAAPGCKSVLKSGGVKADLLSRAQAIAASACAKTSPDTLSLDPFMARAHTGHVSVKARAFAATPHGKAASNKNAVLLKSIDAGR